jgi:hypothetical protein
VAKWEDDWSDDYVSLRGLREREFRLAMREIVTEFPTDSKPLTQEHLYAWETVFESLEESHSTADVRSALEAIKRVAKRHLQGQKIHASKAWSDFLKKLSNSPPALLSLFDFNDLAPELQELLDCGGDEWLFVVASTDEHPVGDIIDRLGRDRGNGVSKFRLGSKFGWVLVR